MIARSVFIKSTTALHQIKTSLKVTESKQKNLAPDFSTQKIHHRHRHRKKILRTGETEQNENLIILKKQSLVDSGST